MKRVFKIFVVLTVSAIVFLYFGNDWLIRLEDDHSSATVKVDGREQVQNAKRMPTAGINFESYSRMLTTIGRSHVHSQLKPVLLESYASLEKIHPEITWIYGETGWKNGARFWPHRTHRNGLSVDFMVPVLDTTTQKPTKLALNAFNAWGYRMRFDAQGLHDSYEIDFAAIVSHLYALKLALKDKGLSIKRVIFDPPLLTRLRAEPSFTTISEIPFMNGSAWFPHDSHYHVDFEIVGA